MNYRHGFHAGNFADVHKHAVLARILVHLREKPAAFRVLDTHAGGGLTDLSGEEANRTGEWREGVGRIRAAAWPAHAASLLAPYLEALGPPEADGPGHYPGSPLMALALMRPQDRLIACEAEPGAAHALEGLLAREQRAKAMAIDGWRALTAYLPPKERRGIVLIDPPFEQPDEFERLPDRLAAAHRKWPTGVYAIWYPIKDRAGPDRFAARLAESGIPAILRSELSVDRIGDGTRLSGSGLVIVNPPWKLAAELEVLGPALAGVLGREGRGDARLAWLSPAP